MSELILQAGEGSLDGSLDPLLGIAAIRIKCWAPDLATAITGAAPALDPNLVENQPRTFSRNVAGDQGGYDVFITLEGHSDPEHGEGEDYSLEGSTSNDPIESHPEFLTLQELYGGGKEPEASTGKMIWPKTLSDDEGEERKNPLFGVEDYLVPGLVWSRRWTSVTLPAGIVRALGTIDAPTGNPPELSGNRNWLKVRARATWRGNIWQIEESWMLSGPDGWNRDIYRY